MDVILQERWLDPGRRMTRVGVVTGVGEWSKTERLSGGLLFGVNPVTESFSCF